MNRLLFTSITPFNTNTGSYIYNIPCSMVLDVLQSSFTEAAGQDLDWIVSFGNITLNFKTFNNLTNTISTNMLVEDEFQSGLNLYIPIFKTTDIPLFMLKGNMVIKVNKDLGALNLVFKDKRYYNGDGRINLLSILSSTDRVNYLISSERYPKMIISERSVKVFEDNKLLGNIKDVFIFPDGYKLNLNEYLKLTDIASTTGTQIFNKIHFDINNLSLLPNWI